MGALSMPAGCVRASWFGLPPLPLRLVTPRSHAAPCTGAYLSTPVTEKELHHGENGRFSFGVASMQGWRTNMEDAHSVRPRFPSPAPGARLALLPAVRACRRLTNAALRAPAVLPRSGGRGLVRSL